MDRFIQGRIPRVSRTRAQQIVASCAFRADGSRRRPSDRVRVGETVLLVRPRFVEPNTPREFSVVYEDDHVLAVDKPAGLPVHPTATYHRNTLTYLLRERFGDPVPVIAHRLDRETSGVVICGKSRHAERALKIAFEHRRVSKRYLAIAEGEVVEDAGVISHPLAPAGGELHVTMRIAEPGDPEGVPARTRYRVRERRQGRTLLELEPETGRQHQLRVHLAALGHPIVGDKLYGREGIAPFLECVAMGMSAGLLLRLGHPRHALHAYSLTVAHPAAGHPLEVCAPLAPDLARLWECGAEASVMSSLGPSPNRSCAAPEPV